MIVGEIQRFLRDDGMVKVSRSIRELSFKIRHVTDDYINGMSFAVLAIEIIVFRYILR